MDREDLVITELGTNPRDWNTTYWYVEYKGKVICRFNSNPLGEVTYTMWPVDENQPEGKWDACLISYAFRTIAR